MTEPRCTCWKPAAPHQPDCALYERECGEQSEWGAICTLPAKHDGLHDWRFVQSEDGA